MQVQLLHKFRLFGHILAEVSQIHAHSCAVGAAYAAEGVTEDSSTIFQRTCAGCHAGGGNILQPVRLFYLALTQLHHDHYLIYRM